MTHASPVAASPARGRRHATMRFGGPHAAPHAGGLYPYRRLAMRVIEQALRDLTGRADSPHDRDSARTFLSGSPMLLLWCEVAEIDPRWITGYLRKMPAGSSERLPAHEVRS
jgi:hypothetical protein